MHTNLVEERRASAMIRLEHYHQSITKEYAKKGSTKTGFGQQRSSKASPSKR